MKRSNVFLTLVLLMALGLAAPASAQYINFQAYGGYTAILGSDYFQDGYDDGWHIGAGVGFGFIPALPISISAEYSEFRVDEEGLLRQNDAPAGAAIDLDGHKPNVIMLRMNLEPGLQLTQNFRAYLTAGPAVAFFMPVSYRITEGGTTLINAEGDTEARFALQGGAGLGYGLMPKMWLFAESRFSYLFTEREDGTKAGFETLPITVGLRFGR